MGVNEKIQKKRKEVGLTQEQVARALNVSIPAVSKWESGKNYPDIELLPAIARLLKTDLNELFDFQEELSDVERINFQLELIGTLKIDSQKGILLAKQKISEYPHDEQLIFSCALLLEGFIESFENNLSYDDDLSYQEVMNLFRKLRDSEDVTIQFNAKMAEIRHLIRLNQLNEARFILDTIPNLLLDKTNMELKLLVAEGNIGEAEKLAEQKILKNSTDLFNYFTEKLEYVIDRGEDGLIEALKEKLFAIIEVCELMPMLGDQIELIIALKKEDIASSLIILERIIEKDYGIWPNKNTMLYQQVGMNSYSQKQFLFNNSFEKTFQEIDLSFIQTNRQFQQLESQWNQNVHEKNLENIYIDISDYSERK